MAKHVFIIEVADTDEPLTEADTNGLEEAFKTIEAVTGATWLGVATGEAAMMKVLTPVAGERIGDDQRS